MGWLKSILSWIAPSAQTTLCMTSPGASVFGVRKQDELPEESRRKSGDSAAEIVNGFSLGEIVTVDRSERPLPAVISQKTHLLSTSSSRVV